MSENGHSGQSGHAGPQPGQGDSPTTVQTQVSEAQARKVAEEARESGWALPSFGKQLFLGDFQLGLIHPHPVPDDEASKRGEEFCKRMREFCEASMSTPRSSNGTGSSRTRSSRDWPRSAPSE